MDFIAMGRMSSALFITSYVVVYVPVKPHFGMAANQFAFGESFYVGSTL
jgi:hypothetical protein